MKNKFILIILFCWIIAGSINLRAQQKITLTEAIDLALQNNPAIKVARNQVNIAEAKNTQARSTFYPQANVLSKYFYSNNLPGMYPLEGVSVPVLNNETLTGDNIIMHPMAPYPNRSRDVMTFDVNVMYPIYAGEKRVNAVKSAEKLKDAYTSDLKNTEEGLRLKVKTAYYNNLFLIEVIDVYNQVLVQLNEHLRLAKIAYKEGVRSEFDVLNLQSKIEEFKHRMTEIKGNKVVAGTALNNLLTLPDTANVTVDGSLSQYIQHTGTRAWYMDDIRKGNYKLQSLQHLKEALNQKKKIESAGKLPTIFTFGNYHLYHGMDFPPFDKTWRNGFAIGIGLKINLFDGNRTKGRVQEMNATIDKINNYREGLNLQLRYQYNKAIEDIQSLHAQKKAAKEHLAVAEKAYHIAEVGYENGVITNIELNDSQLNVTKVKLSLLSIDKNLLLEYAELEYLHGGNK